MHILHIHTFIGIKILRLFFTYKMVELRKRKAPANPPVPEKKTKAPKPQPDVDVDVAADVDVEVKKSSKVPEVDDIIDIESFGGEVQTNDGETTSLKKLLDESKAGVVFFTYPKASTPGCKYLSVAVGKL